MGEILDTIRKFEARKDAAVGEERSGHATTEDDGARLVLSGLDLDLEELHEARHMSAAAAIEHINAATAEGMDLNEAVSGVLAGLWVDGLATGMHLQQDREKDDAATE